MSAGFAPLHDHCASLGCKKLPVVFFVAKKADIARPRGIERSHAGVRRIEPAPDDVTIDPTGELGKREVLGQFPAVRLLGFLLGVFLLE